MCHVNCYRLGLCRILQSMQFLQFLLGFSKVPVFLCNLYIEAATSAFKFSKSLKIGLK